MILCSGIEGNGADPVKTVGEVGAEGVPLVWGWRGAIVHWSWRWLSEPLVLVLVLVLTL